MVNFVKNQLLPSSCNLIAVPVNCYNKLVSDLQKEVKDSFPECYDGYKYSCHEGHEEENKGTVLMCPIVDDRPANSRKVVFMYVNDLHNGKEIIDRQALTKCLTTLKETCIEESKSIAFKVDRKFNKENVNEFIYLNSILITFSDDKVECFLCTE